MAKRLITFLALVVCTPYLGAAQTPTQPLHTAQAVSTASQPAIRPRPLAQWARDLGLGRANASFRYVRRQAARDQIIYSGVEFGPRNAIDGRADRLVISLDPATGGASPAVRIEGGQIETRNEPVRFSALTIDQLSTPGGGSVAQALTQTLGRSADGSGKAKPSARLTGNWQFEGLSQAGTSTGDRLQIESLTLVQLGQGASDEFRLKSVRMAGLKAISSGYQVDLAFLELEDISPSLIAKIFAPKAEESGGMVARPRGLGRTGLAMSDVGLKRFEMRGLAISPKPVESATANDGSEGQDPAGRAARAFAERLTKPALDTFSLGKVVMTDLSPTRLGAFSAEDLSLNAGMGQNQGQMKLARFSMSGVSLDHWARLGRYFGGLFKSPAAKDGGDTAKNEGTPQASATSPSDPTKLIDVLKGGPLDSGLEAFEMAGLDIDVDGVSIDLDRLAIATTKQADGLFVQTRMPLGGMSITVSDGSKAAGQRVQGLLQQLKVERLDLKWAVNATYDPVTDLYRMDEGLVEATQFGRLVYGVDLGGMGAFMRNTSYATLFEGSGAGSGGAIGREMAMLARVYKGISLKSGQVKLQDLGGIERVATIFAGTGPNSADKTSQAVRQRWAESNRSKAADKKRTLLERQISLAIARWVEQAGSIEIAARPDPSVDVGALLEGKVAPDAMNLSVTNTGP